MAQVKLLKIHTTGVPIEFASTDDITLNSFTAGAGPVMSPTGIEMNDTDVTEISDLSFTDPSVGTVNQTAGSLIIDNIMAKERSNTLTTAADILFPTISDSAGQVDALRLPALAGAPTATPTASGEGFLVWDSTNNYLWAWDGSTWVNQTTATSAQAIDDTYTADEALLIRDAVYLSGADNVSKASAAGDTTAQLLGFATAAASDTASVVIRKFGVLTGFSGLTAGARYYLSATAGLITSTIPVGTGNVIVQAGYAKSATALDIQIESLGRRAS